MNYKFTWNQQKIYNMLFSYKAYLEQVAAEYVLERAQARAPVDIGLLKSDIFITVMDGKLAVVAVATKGDKPGGDEYAKYVEFGHMTSGVNKSWVGPNPFMRSAIWDAVSAFPRLASQINITAPASTVHHFGLNQVEITPNVGVDIN